MTTANADDRCATVRPTPENSDDSPMPVWDRQDVRDDARSRGSIATLLGLIVALGFVAVRLWFDVDKDPHDPSTAPVVTSTDRTVEEPVDEPAPVEDREVAQPDVAEPMPDATVVLPPDEEAIAAAEADWTRAVDRRTEAEASLHRAGRALGDLTESVGSRFQAWMASRAARRDDVERFDKVSTRRNQWADYRAKLEDRLASLGEPAKPTVRASTVRPTPVAEMIVDEEQHFELRQGRISVIDLDALLTKVEADARLRLRIGTDRGGAGGEVGPIGAFRIRYEVTARSIGGPGGSFLGGVEYIVGLWELVPITDLRGETFETLQHPASDFSRHLNRYDPTRTTLTLWVYPDSFVLYRQVRDLLHDRGYRVAGRPLPEDVPIRGSPSGTLSAAQ